MDRYSTRLIFALSLISPCVFGAPNYQTNFASWSATGIPTPSSFTVTATTIRLNGTVLAPGLVISSGSLPAGSSNYIQNSNSPQSATFVLSSASISNLIASIITAMSANFSSSVTASNFYGDGSGLTNLPAQPGDNFGNHIATKSINMSLFDLQSINALRLGDATNGTIALDWFAEGPNRAWRLQNATGNIYVNVGGVPIAFFQSNGMDMQQVLRMNGLPIQEISRAWINQSGEVVTPYSFRVGASSFVVRDSGYVGVSTSNPTHKLSVDGGIVATSSITASSFFGDGSGLTNLPAQPGDNLGNHIATTTLNMNNFQINNASDVKTEFFTASSSSTFTSSATFTTADIIIKTQGYGLILRATDGANCYKLTLNNTGILSTTLTTCP